VAPAAVVIDRNLWRTNIAGLCVHAAVSDRDRLRWLGSKILPGDNDGLKVSREDHLAEVMVGEEPDEAARVPLP
jgi:hypothetical protein